MENFRKGNNREEKVDIFLDNLGWYFSQKETPIGLHSKIGKIEERLESLNENLKESNNSSNKLTSALNKITLFSAIIAGFSLLLYGIDLFWIN